MTQPPISGRGPGEEPARDSGSPGGGAAAPGRDPRLAGFAHDGPGDTCRPGPELAAIIAELSGPEWRCAGATDEELIGLLGRWDAIGSWAEAGKLGVVRELLRRRARPGLGGGPPVHGDLPDQWEEGVGHEVSAALQVSLRSADNLTAFGWDLQARLPGIGAALADGALTPVKARIISDELKVLDDERAAQAEKLILDRLDGQTPAQLGRLAAQAVVTVDPDGAARRREHAEREEARVRFWRDNGGACALAAFGLPTDAALAANDAINGRAAAYKAAEIRPGARMDQLRVLAFLDLLNGITLENRITQDLAAQARQASDVGGGASTSDRDGDGSTSDDAGDDQGGTRPDDDGSAHASDGGHNTSAGDVSTSDADGADSAGDKAGDGSTNGDLGGGRPVAPAVAPVLPALTARANLTLPLATLLGWPNGPAPRTASAPSTPPWSATSPHLPPPARTASGASPSPTPTAWPSRTAARNQPGRRRTGPPAATGRSAGRSPRPATQDRPAGTAPGSSPCRAARNWPSGSSRSR